MAPTLSAPVRWLFTSALAVYRAVARSLVMLSSKKLSQAEHRVVSGAAWDEFCDTLKAAGAAVLAPGAPRDPFNQAEGYRYLARLARAGLENFVECADVEAPQLSAIANGSRAARVCIGSDNPDNLYENATIDGRREYVVCGTRGTVAYLGLGTQSGSYGGKGGLATVDYAEADTLAYDDAARTRFTVVLSAERPVDWVGNWLRLAPDPAEAMFIVRQTFSRRAEETPAALTIVLRDGGGGGGPAPLTPAKLDQGLQQAALLVAGASAMFAKWAHDFQAHENSLPLFDQARSDSAGGDPNIRYYHSYWRLPAGTALRIRVTPPPCRFWNFQLNNHWMESLDYRHFAVHTNDSLARADAADTAAYTILVAHADPNAGPTGWKGNWVQTVGHECGTMCFRWVSPRVPDEALPHPKVEVVRFDEL